MSANLETILTTCLVCVIQYHELIKFVSLTRCQYEELPQIGVEPPPSSFIFLSLSLSLSLSPCMNTYLSVFKGITRPYNNNKVFYTSIHSKPMIDVIFISYIVLCVRVRVYTTV